MGRYQLGLRLGSRQVPFIGLGLGPRQVPVGVKIGV